MTNRLKLLQTKIITDYNENKLTTQNIAIKYNLNIKSVIKILKENNIFIRKRKQNLLGNSYGRLKVIKFTKSDSNKKLMWECLCTCGNISEVRGSDLISGKVQSCGCLHSEISKQNLKKAHIKYPNSFGFKGIGDLQGKYISSIKYNAMKRRIEYSISKEYLWELYQKQKGKCALTGLEISLKSNKIQKQTASIDRIDSSKGYIVGNVQWVHKDINNIKQYYSIEELIKYAKLLINNYESTK